MFKLKVKRLNDKAVIPFYAHAGDAGLDLFSTEDLVIKSGCTGLVPTGIAIEIPKNCEAQIRPRSGLAFKNQITVLNTPGTIDEGYRGEIKVILINHGKEEFNISIGDKIAQMVIAPYIRVDIEETYSLDGSERGENGFGSTGKK